MHASERAGNEAVGEHVGWMAVCRTERSITCDARRENRDDLSRPGFQDLCKYAAALRIQSIQPKQSDGRAADAYAGVPVLSASPSSKSSIKVTHAALKRKEHSWLQKQPAYSLSFQTALLDGRHTPVIHWPSLPLSITPRTWSNQLLQVARDLVLPRVKHWGKTHQHLLFNGINRTTEPGITGELQKLARMATEQEHMRGARIMGGTRDDNPKAGVLLPDAFRTAASKSLYQQRTMSLLWTAELMLAVTRRPGLQGLRIVLAPDAGVSSELVVFLDIVRVGNHRLDRLGRFTHHARNLLGHLLTG